MKGWYESGTELESIEHVNTEDACREKCAAVSSSIPITAISFPMVVSQIYKQ